MHSACKVCPLVGSGGMPPGNYFKINTLRMNLEAFLKTLFHTSTLFKEGNSSRTYTFSYIYKVEVISLLLVSVHYYYIIQALLGRCCSCIILNVEKDLSAVADVIGTVR